MSPPSPLPTSPPSSPGYKPELTILVGGATRRSRWLRLLKWGGIACLVSILAVLLPVGTLPPAPTPIAARAGLTAVLPVTQPIDPEQVPAKLGHFPYAEAKRQRLMVVSSYSQDNEQRFERLDRAAALALMKMIDAARLDGVWIVPVSGFRDLERQETLFQRQSEHLGSDTAAAKSVAPPGYSEHHTGLAVDLADGLAPTLDVSLAFGQSAAFQWLLRYAPAYGYELSFPRDNPQGVNYEPWHWRYVGSIDARRIFAVAQS